ncbi:MAG: hypothetical protein K2Y32_07735 [Candidatus Obscuribacterales bacterium]|nr:hypothetical protein [Candidatus Obscuribacterales bacterium]
MNPAKPNILTVLQARQAVLDKERQAKDELAAARVKLEERDYKGALRAFKKYFKMDGDQCFSVIAKDVATLVKNYQPARLIVQRYRNDKEKLILQGQADSKLVGQLVLLNLGLGERSRTEAFYRELKQANFDTEISELFLRHVWRQLLRRRRYEDLRPYFHSLGFFLLLHITELDCHIWFPDLRTYSKTEIRNWRERCLKSIIEEGPLTYELALGLGEMQAANLFAQRILGVEASDRVYAALIKAALRARAADPAKELYKEARSTLGSRRIRQTNKAFRLS